MITTYTKMDLYKPFLTIVTEGSLITEDSVTEPIEPIVSPKNLCTIDGCYRLTEEKLCEEHQMFTSLEYIISHKPIQSPVAASKYNSEQKGLSYVRMYTDK